MKGENKMNWQRTKWRWEKGEVCVVGTRQPLVELMITESDMKSSFWRVNTTVWLLMQWKCRVADEIYRFNTIGKTLIVLSHAMRIGQIHAAQQQQHLRQHSNPRHRSFPTNHHRHHHSEIHIAWASSHSNVAISARPARARTHKYLTVSNGWN